MHLQHGLLTSKQHEGHDYNMYRSAFGGSCDCGDPESWKPEGFCDLHRGCQQPAEQLDEDFKLAVQTTVRLVVEVLSQHLASRVRKAIDTQTSIAYGINARRLQQRRCADDRMHTLQRLI